MRTVRLVSSRLIICCSVILITLLVLSRALDRGLNHDEHQFIAPAVLFSRSGFLPYKDFAFFHMPNSVLLYGLAASLTSYKILAMRLVAGLAGALFVSLFFLYAWRQSKAVSLRMRILTAGSLTVILLTSPIFLSTSGLTWNHDLPMLFSFIAFLLTCRASEGHSRRLLLFLSGLCVALATGTRLTFAPLFAPFLLAPLLFPEITRGEKIRLMIWFSVGSLIGMAPALYFFATAREAFWFGNFEYPRLPAMDPDNLRIQKTLAPWRKFRYFFKEIALSNWPILLVFLGIGLPAAIAKWRMRTPGSIRALVNLLILPFALFGAFAPSRYQYQHFYAVMPFLLLTGVHAIREKTWRLRIALCSIALASLFAGRLTPRADFETAITTYKGSLHTLAKPEKWFPLQAHRQAAVIRTYVPSGKLLTLAPAFACEAGVDIYRELALGPFAWRNAHLLSPERREKFHIWAPEDLDTAMLKEPAAGVLVGYEPERLEARLKIYAQVRGDRAIPLRGDTLLYVPQPATNAPTQ